MRMKLAVIGLVALTGLAIVSLALRNSSHQRSQEQQQVTASLDGEGRKRLPPENAVSPDMDIPCIIHRTRKSLIGIDEATAIQMIDSWSTKNPQCLHVVWTDASMAAWLRAAAPQYVPEYFALQTGVERSDFFRYIVVLVVGGVYADTDVECLKPVSEWAFGQTGIDAVVGMEWDRPHAPGNDYQVVQWTFAAAPNHTIMRRAVEIVQSNIRREASGERMWYHDMPPDNQIIKRTGPLAWTPAIQEHLERHHVTF
jgi:mannosyltransferase OCH1-like enzyme